MGNKLWDSDTGIITLTATDAAGAPVNLTGATTRVIKIRNRTTGTVTAPTVTSVDLANGKVSANVTSLAPGEYDAILRVTDAAGNIATYPSADLNPARFAIRADMDAVTP